ncbi:maturation protein [ssRNA phage Gerhypos.3_8]|uniref:Maturation protein n=2 Tax=Leviviricetes TaxID=2842243 RepID=A0A8S5L2Y0_9VIRU|nr:maturation protein [ssRNA phage Gerhypos.3_8]QDH91079.1 MAG: hypothetical protein H3Bulk41462_000004 [Leviviridae sp.]DAD52025.1 TPA_asm: maturation protein [ssRNA phage Gerhypos.3_8]
MEDNLVKQSRVHYRFQLQGRAGLRYGGPDQPLSWVTSLPGEVVTCKQTTTSHRGSDLANRTVADLLGQYDATKPVTDNGHEFRTEKQSIHFSIPHIDFSGRDVEFHGPWGYGSYGTYWDNNFPVAPQVSQNDIRVYGTKAINQAIPTKSAASLAQFLGELREGLPALVGVNLLRGKGSTNSIGSEYLNYQFGIAPLLNDIKKFASAVKNSSRIIKQYERDSGRVVRRKRGLSGLTLNTHEETELSKWEAVGQPQYVSGWYPDFWNSFRNSGGKTESSVTQIYHTTRRAWFSGAFSYYLNSGDDVIARFDRYEQLANKLLGTRLTLEVLYQLTPWSWLADWFADIGDIISSASAFASDRLVLRYGYLMVHTVSRNQFTSSAVLPSGQRIHPSTEYKTERKERFRASPYGFGIDSSAFTDYQWAILGALGMTKAPRSLR